MQSTNPTMTNAHTTTTYRTQMLEMFLDGTPNEVYNSGRLATVDTGESVQLIAYGSHVIAEIQDKEVTLYTGHHGQHSETVDTYIEALGSVLSETPARSVKALEEAAPSLGHGSNPADAAKYIGSYIGSFENLSKVERGALNEVNEALGERMDALFE